MTPAFLDLIDLAAERLGASVVAANDEFFAPKEQLIAPEPPVWMEGRYTERGKWMDGWETRRRREPGHDWCIVRLGVPGIVRGVDVDTTHFKGNCPEACAIDVCDLDGLPTTEELERADWREVLPRVTLNGDSRNFFVIDAAPRAGHVRLRIFPDGGVARLRAHGEVAADWARLRARGQVDLAAVEHGGVVVACSDMFFGSRHNLIMPGGARNMGDGWETRRRRGPGHDWTVVRLGAAGTIERVEVDTRHFKGNAPGACSLEGCDLSPIDGAGVVPGQSGGRRDQEDWRSHDWRERLPRTRLQPHARHDFERELQPIGRVTCVRFNIYPDGGVGRLRLFGRPA
jgi:allantoicase